MKILLTVDRSPLSTHAARFAIKLVRLLSERERQPVQLAVALLGTTEYGTIDPVDGVVGAHDRFAACGLGVGVHLDGACGGYLATLFRRRGRCRSRSECAMATMDRRAPT